MQVHELSIADVTKATMLGTRTMHLIIFHFWKHPEVLLG